MFAPLIFWLWFAGLVVLVLGIIATRKSIAACKGIEKVIALGPLFFAAPLAVFGAEHFTNTASIIRIVPAWMPARTFWAYFVGVALLCASISFASNLYRQLSSTLVGVMFVSFVLMIHIPGVIANPNNRVVWDVAFRDLSFGGGALALAAIRARSLRIVARVLVAVPLLVFAAQHFLHPQFAPGVPLAKITPEWVPIRIFWGYLTGAALLISGATMLLAPRNRRARESAALLGLWIALLVLLLYLPILLTAAAPARLEGINYVADTLLFGGTVLLAAGILGDGKTGA